jgi:hypothetical protein
MEQKGKREMNALQIADELDGRLDHVAANMLRQQKAEIEALKKEAALQRLSDFTQEADNEPVAWIEPDVIPLTHIIKAVVRREQDEQYSIPLYTHPVKEQLTDEEIIKVYEDMLGVASAKGSAIDFARAILRKAQEK